MQTLSNHRPDPEQQAFLDQVISSRTGRPGALLGILEAIQEHERHKYLPLPVLEYVAARTGVPLARVYSVATFYSLFNLDPQGDHTVSICRGTACHTRGSRNLLQAARLELGLNPENGDEEKNQLTTADHRFTLRTVACFGQCAMAPVVEFDRRICGHVSERTLQRELEAIDRGAH